MEQLRWRALAVFPAAFDRRAATAVWELNDEDEAQDALTALRSYSLLEYDAGRWRLHDLARLFADAQLTEAERTNFAQRHATHFCVVLKEARELYLQGGAAVVQGMNLFDQERDHIESGQAWAATRSGNEQLNDKAAAQLCVDYANAGAYVIQLRLHPREQIRWLESQLAAARRLRLREDESIALGNLGSAYLNLGDTRQAITYYEQALVIRREIGDRRGEGTDLWNLALALDKLGKHAQAIAHAEASLKIREETEDPRADKVRRALAEWRSAS